MENRKGNGLFLSVIGVATLVVAIIGATFAYFSASAVSNNDAINLQSANLTLGYWEDPSGLNTDMIPTVEKYALFAATEYNWINNDPEKNVNAIEGATGLCHDQNNNEICSTYVFSIGNPNFTTAMNINGKITTTINEFENLKFAIYNENGEQVFEPTALPKDTGGYVELGNLDQDTPLEGSSLDVDNESFDAADPSTYTKIPVDPDDEDNKIAKNVRTYTVVIWIEEKIVEGKPQDQTSVDAGKIFTAGITFDTGSGSGVTGLIAAADKTN